jgi:imidazolonepropionase-like amidohydrolase
MRNLCRRIWVVLALTSALCEAARGQGANPTSVKEEAAEHNAAIVIENVTVISPERKAPLEHATVVVRDGRIVEVGTNRTPAPNVKRIDGRGKFLIPGLIDTHVHLGELAPLDDDGIEAHPELVQSLRAQIPRAFLSFGFTTIVDLNLVLGTLEWFNAAPLHPSLFHCGPAARIPGGYTAQRAPKDAQAAQRMNLVYDKAHEKEWPANLDPQEFTPERAVERAAATGAICVKTFVEPGFGGVFQWPVPSTEALSAMRAATKKRGLVFVVHANGVEGWQAALSAQADVIAHGLWHWPGDRQNTVPTHEAEEIIRKAARAEIGVQPTMQVVYGEQSVFDRSILEDPRLAQALPRSVIVYLKSDPGKAAWQATAEEYKQAMTRVFSSSVEPTNAMAIAGARVSATTHLLQIEGGRLLFGSDTPSGEGIGNPQGLNGRLELERWLAAGVPLAQILRAATMENAKAFGLEKDRGTIEVGKRADLLLLTADPLKTIKAYDAIEGIFLGGKEIARKDLLPLN